MNVYSFRYFISKRNWGKSFNTLKKLQQSDTFKRAHFRVYIPSKTSNKAIIALGQTHTVLTGKISSWTAKKIGKCQARLYMYYRYLFHHLHIPYFGEEGVTDHATEGLFRYHLHQLKEGLSPEEYEAIEKGKIPFSEIKKILIRLSKKWQSMLKILQGAPEQVAPYADLVSGALLYSLENTKVLFFAIEGEKAYRFVLNKIRQIEQQINDCKKRPPFVSATKKGFKKLNQEEYQAVIDCNQQVKMFNKVLGSTLRDEATLNALIARLNDQDMVVYTIGMAHEKNLFKLAKSYLGPQGISLIMILPPELWFWKGVVLWIKRILILGIIIACIIFWIMYV